jgi:hypothetical protein
MQRPWRDSRYLQWIRSLPCVVCGTERSVEAAHTGPHGLGQKSADSTAIPLCSRHHRTGNDSYHKLGARRFSEVHDLNLHRIASELRGKPEIRIDSGVFIARIGRECHLLGPVGDGLSRAARKAMILKNTIARVGLERHLRCERQN